MPIQFSFSSTNKNAVLGRYPMLWIRIYLDHGFWLITDPESDDWIMRTQTFYVIRFPLNNFLTEQKKSN
jgi:hypothetical protein